MSSPAASGPGSSRDAGQVPALTVGAVLLTRLGHLVVAMLVVELLAGMQVYINQTVLPLLATDLHARSHYGLVTAAAQVPAFLTMPLGGAMLARWRADRLMTTLTAVLVVGAVAGALAPGVTVYVAAEVLRGLASGALATVTMGVLVAGLPESWKRLFLAASSATWVVSSLLGPAYAAATSSAWGWRWALVAYVPLLVAARLVMSREIRGLHVEDDGSAAPWPAALALAAGVGLIGVLPAGRWWFWPGCLLGAAGVAWACARVFPAGTVRLAPGRRAALATLAWVCTAYFPLDFLVSPGAHDVLGLGPGPVGWALTCAGVLWSVVAMWCGAHPARPVGRYLLRAVTGAACFAAGAGLMALTFAAVLPWWWLHVGFGLAGVGMGLTHQDTMVRCVTQPGEVRGRRDAAGHRSEGQQARRSLRDQDGGVSGGADSSTTGSTTSSAASSPDDGISETVAATSVTVATTAGGAALGTFVTALVAPTAAGVESTRLVGVVVVLAVLLACTPLLARRVG